MQRVEGTPAAIIARLRDGPRQAQDLAEDLGIDTSAVRRHLENLRANGLVHATDHIEGPGRPKKLYALTPEGRETFPRAYALLLDLLIQKTEATRGRAQLEALLRGIADDLAANVAGKTTDARLDNLLALYNGLGFEADLERHRGGAITLRQRNCIFLKTARTDPPLMCQCFDEGIIRAAIPGAHVELETSLARGDNACKHLIRVGKGRA